MSSSVSSKSGINHLLNNLGNETQAGDRSVRSWVIWIQCTLLQQRTHDSPLAAVRHLGLSDWHVARGIWLRRGHHQHVWLARLAPDRADNVWTMTSSEWSSLRWQSPAADRRAAPKRNGLQCVVAARMLSTHEFCWSSSWSTEEGLFCLLCISNHQMQNCWGSIFPGSALDAVWTRRCEDLTRAVDRLASIRSQDALVLLKAPLNAPRVQYLLNCSPSIHVSALQTFDDHLRLAVSNITNSGLSTAGLSTNQERRSGD